VTPERCSIAFNTPTERIQIIREFDETDSKSFRIGMLISFLLERISDDPIEDVLHAVRYVLCECDESALSPTVKQIRNAMAAYRDEKNWDD
jgi:hypothetical protein